MNTNNDVRALQMRIGALERQVRGQRWQLLGGIAVTLAVVWFLLPAAAATVEAESFVLNDASGSRRVEMSMVLDQPTVTLYDADGQLRGAFRLGADGRPEYINPTGEAM